MDPRNENYAPHMAQFLLLFCNTTYAEDIKPAQTHTKHCYFPSQNGCQNIELFFKFKNQFTTGESADYFVAKNFNVETTMPIEGWGADQDFVYLPMGESITYKNTYTTSPAIITGHITYHDPKIISRILCSISFYHDAVRDGCYSEGSLWVIIVCRLWAVSRLL